MLVGIVVSLTALLIDLTGFHTSPGFGTTQIAGVAIVVASIFGGLVVLVSSNKLPTQ